jgi:hypothetical protein
MKNMNCMNILERFPPARMPSLCCRGRMSWAGSLKQGMSFAAIALFILLSFCRICLAESAADIVGAKVTAKPAMVYVADFALDVESGSKKSKGLLPARQKIKDTVNRTGVTGKETPEERAKKIVDAMADSIVKELNDKNIKARRLFSQPPPFTDCLLLEGEFMDFDEGERMKRAIIGFGSGSSEMQVRMMFSEIMDGKTSLLIDTATDGKKSRMPGAVLTKNPYVAGAKFVLTKNAPEKDVKKLGSNIADKLNEFMIKQGYVAQQEK